MLRDLSCQTRGLNSTHANNSNTLPDGITAPAQRSQWSREREGAAAIASPYSGGGPGLS